MAVIVLSVIGIMVIVTIVLMLVLVNIASSSDKFNTMELFIGSSSALMVLLLLWVVAWTTFTT